MSFEEVVVGFWDVVVNQEAQVVDGGGGSVYLRDVLAVYEEVLAVFFEILVLYEKFWRLWF